jgi:hypothetical protein
MFADPFSNLMLVMLLFFGGLLIMFIFMMRSLDNNWRNQEETRRQMDLSLSDLGRKIDELLYCVRRESGLEGGAKPLPGDFPPEGKAALQESSLPGEIFGYAGDSAAGDNKRQFGDLKLRRTAPDLSAVLKPEAQDGKEAGKA